MRFDKDYLELFRKVKFHMAWTDEKTAFWFSTENPHIGGCTPNDYFKRRKEKCIKWVEMLVELHSPNTPATLAKVPTRS